jgi:hypothetical protein
MGENIQQERMENRDICRKTKITKPNYKYAFIRKKAIMSILQAKEK